MFDKISARVSVLIFLNVMIQAIAGRHVTAFLPQFVKWTGVSDVDAGIKVGSIDAVHFSGRLITCFLWGHLVDTIGCKRCAIISGICITTTTLGLGFSSHVWSCMLVMFICGFAMGQAVICNSIMCEFSSRKSLPFGLSLVTVGLLCGGVVGPAIGGFLVFPRQQYPNVFGSENVFSKFPLLLPCHVVASGGLLVVILTFLFLPDKRQDDPVDGKEERQPLCESEIKRTEEENENDESKKDDSPTSYKKTRKSVINETRQSRLLKVAKNSRFYRVCSKKEGIFSIILYGAFAFLSSGFQEVLPLILTTAQAYNGMGWSPADVGTIMLIEAIITVVMQITVVPLLNNYINSKLLLFTANILLALVFPTVPATALTNQQIALRATIIILYALIRFAICSGFVVIKILLSNSVEPAIVGSAFGLAAATATFGRGVSTAVCGKLFSWSLRNVKRVQTNNSAAGFPFDTYFVFIFLSLVALLLASFTWNLPSSMILKKEEVKK